MALAPWLGDGGPGPRVCFRSPPGAAGEGLGSLDKGPVRRQGKVKVKYNRRELQKHLNLEEWVLEQPLPSTTARKRRLMWTNSWARRVMPPGCQGPAAAGGLWRPTEASISGLLDTIRACRSEHTPEGERALSPGERWLPRDDRCPLTA